MKTQSYKQQMKTPHSTVYRYAAETVAAANRIPVGSVNESSHKLGMERGEPVIVMLDGLLKYAEVYRSRYAGDLAQDKVLGACWLDALRAVHGLLDGDGVVAMRLGRSTDSKDNSACEQVFADALRLAGYDRDAMGF